MFLIALGIAGLLFGIGGNEVRRFENAAGKDIAAKLIGEKKQVKVRTKFDPFAILDGRLKSATITAADFQTDGLPFFTNPEGSQKGRLNELKLDLQRFTLGHLAVERLRTRIPDCRFDFGLATKHGRIRLTRSGEGTGEVEVKQEALREFVLWKFREIKRLNIRLEDNRAVVEGYGEFLIFNTNFKVEGSLETPDGNRLVLTNVRITFDGKEADEASQEVLLKALNPVVDLDRDLHLFGAIRVQSLQLQGGVLRAKGKTKIPNDPNGTKSGLSVLSCFRWPICCASHLAS